MLNKSLFGIELNFQSWAAERPRPTSNSLLLRTQSQQLIIGFQQSCVTTESTINILYSKSLTQSITVFYVTNLGDHNSMTILLFCMRLCFFCSCNEGMGMMQPKCRSGGVYCRSQESASGREWMLGIPKRNGGNGFLKQTCRRNLFSAVLPILRTWAAERLAAPLPTLCG